ncbi:conserved repeat domain-containing protein [Paraoerskovia marina]|uniref:Conserved repeat domain-containing protein n=1 Tax=Paraoerskovia marina TaxID=545619 RepID=A0A1H1RS06_9CELL|nr:GEVED domain-containing protein [Paraoerskovia marina]SDS38498.1 conserved repeat domain-containing protein [Paraoerskovia marina]
MTARRGGSDQTGLRAVRRQGLAGAVGSSLVLTLGLVAAPVVYEPLANDLPAAEAVPGSPGVMEAPTNFYAENFENVTWQEPVGAGGGSDEAAWDADDYVQSLTEYPFGDDGTAADFQPGYVNENGTTTYSADSPWAAGNNCNGFIVAQHTNGVGFQNLSGDFPIPTSGPAAACGEPRSFNGVLLMANVMGQYHNNANQYPYFDQDLGNPESQFDNHVVSSYTSGSAIEPGTMLEFDEPIDVDPGRYYQASVDIAAMSCIPTGNGAIPQIYLTQSDGTESPVFSNAINTCSPGSLGEIYQYGPGGGATIPQVGKQRTTRVGTFLGDQALRSTGDTLGIRINNDQSATNGNDSAFDNLVVLDTTPKIDKEFTPEQAPVGTPAELTFTITNTYDPVFGEDTPSGPKEDFGFTDTINDSNLQLTGTSETTCGDGTVTVDPATGTVDLVGGDLVDPNLVSCTVTVGVTSDVEGTFTNGPDDMELIGLNPPGDTDITFFEDGLSCDSDAYLLQNNPADLSTVNLVNGDSEEILSDFYPNNVNAAGYNPVEDFIYGIDNTASPHEIVRLGASGQAVSIGAPDDPLGIGWPNSAGWQTGDFDTAGYLWILDGQLNSGTPWRQIDLVPGSPTYGSIVDGGQVARPSSVRTISDWTYNINDGLFYTFSENSNQVGVSLVTFDPANPGLTVVEGLGTPTAPDGTSGLIFGAMYSDADGNIYGSLNNNGDIFRYSPDGEFSFFAYGPPSAGNDGARCVLAPLPLDFGDAPDSYNTLLGSEGPFHSVVDDVDDPLLTIGDTVTVESDGQPDVSAGLDEDDAFAEDPTVNIDAAESTLTIPITNNSSDGAALAGWIDFDLSGTFDEDERSVIDTGLATGDAVLTWSVPADAVVGDSYLRLRAALVPGDDLPTDTSDIGPGVDSGEVEDWPITLEELPRDFGDAPDSFGTLDASGGASHGVIDYDDTTNTAPLMLGDSTTVDVEEDGVPTVGADGDDLADVDDEAAIAEPVVAGLDSPFVTSVTATNDSLTDATLVGWLDVNNNGVFDTGEISDVVAVPAESGAADYALTLPAPTSTDDTYLRLRLFAGGNDTPLPTGAWTGGEVEDYLVTVVEPELAVEKTASTDEAAPGEDVTYTITVENTGAVDFTESNPATVSDDLSGVIDDATYNDDAAATSDVDGNTPPAPSYTEPELSWSGPLAAGETVTITYTVTVADPLSETGDGVLDNVVSAPFSNCEDTPDAPECNPQVPIKSLEITKSADPGDEVLAGETVTYSITVENTGGYAYTALDPVTVTDDLTDVLDDATYVDGSEDATSSIVANTPPVPSYSDPVLSWTGPLDVGETVTITYQVTVDDPLSETGDGILDNAVTGPEESTCPPDSTDPECNPQVPVKALDITKASDADGSVAAGDVVTYTVTVENTGQVDYVDPDLVEISDDLSAVLDDATYNDDAAAVSSDGVTVDDPTFADPTLSWSGPLAAGETVEITYSVTVDDPPGDGADGLLDNAVVGPPESNCDPDQDPADPDCTTSVASRSLDITKSADPAGEVLAGESVEYTITLENTGEADYTVADPADISDDLSGVLDDATYNDDAAAVSSDGASVDDPTFADPTLSWSGPIAAGQTVTITYSVTVDDPPSAGADGNLENAVVGPPESNCDEDQDPADPDCTTQVPVKSVDILKTADGPETLQPGDTVEYTIEVTNTGGVDYVDPDLVEISDDLSDVLNDADYDGNAVATSNIGGNTPPAPTYTAPELSWAGPLEVGETVTITYSVTLTDPPGPDADGQLDNAVVGPPESNCDENQSPPDPACSETVPEPLLELTKESDAVGEVLPGDTVTYTVTVENIGDSAYTDAVPAYVFDDLTDVLDDATYNDDAVATPDQGEFDYTEPVLTWFGPLAPGELVTITYSVTVDDPPGDDADGVLFNALVAEGSNCDEDTDDPDCTDTVPVRSLDIDKSSDAGDSVAPGDVVTYSIAVTNTGSVDYTLLDPAVVVDDLTDVLDDGVYNDDAVATSDIVANVPPAPQYENPQLSWQGPLEPGETVTITYSITVDDPLADDADGVLANTVVGPPESSCDPEQDPADPDCTVTTPIRELGVVKTSDAVESVAPGDVVTYTVEVTNTGQAPYTVEDPATVTDDLSGVLDDATYNGDAAATSDGDTTPPAPVASAVSETITWSGPLEVGETVTITYSVTVDDPPGEDADGVLENAVTGPDSNCPEGSTDPDCTVTTPVRGLDVVKTSDAGGEVAAGDTVTYTVTVTNTGGFDYTVLTPVEVSDDLTGVLDDAEYNDDAAANPDSGTFAYTEPVLTWTGPLAAGESVELTYSVTVEDPLAEPGDGVLENTVVVPGTNCPEGSEDPDCTVTTPVRSLEIVKTSDNDNGEVDAGETILYTIEVTNTGAVDYVDPDLVVITDDLSNVLDDAAYNDDAAATSTGAVPPAPTYTEPVLSWTGPLAAGETVTITYSVTVDDPPTGDQILSNTVVGPPESNCDPDQIPADPDCTAEIPEHAASVVKTSDAGESVVPGDVVTYEVVVTNTGAIDYTDAFPLKVADDLSEVLDDATYNDDAAAAPEAGEFVFADPFLQWTGPLAVGESVTLTYSVTVDDPPGAGADGELTNVVIVPGSNCPEGTEDPDCSTTTPVRSLDIVKTSDAVGSVTAGDTVEYTVTITNTGTVDYADGELTVSDDLTGVLDDATYNDDAAANPDTGVFDYTEPVLTWTGGLAAGESVELTYSVTVNDPDEGDASLVNAVVGPPESNCEEDSEDPDCTETVPVRRAEVAKTSDAAGSVLPGDVVTYTVTIENTGDAPYTMLNPATMVDDLTDVLDDATYNDDATAMSSVVTSTPPAPAYARPDLTWTGPLAVGETVTITYSVTVDDPLAESGDGVLDNAVVGPEGSNCPEGSEDPDCTETVPVQSLEIAKTSDVEGSVAPGETVTYTVVVTNTGAVDYTDASPVVVVDDLSEVLDDAAYNDDAAASPASGSFVFADPELTWTGPLVAGESVELTYSVTIDDPVDGDHVVTNTIVGPPESNCQDGSEDPDCGTSEPIRELDLVKTSDGGSDALESGQVVTYEITVTNTGQAPYTGADPAVITDDLSDVLDDATYNDDAAVDPDQGLLDYTEPVLSWTGPLDVGASVTITYSVTVNDPDEGDKVLRNSVVGPPESNCDPDQTPADPDCTEIVPQPDLTLAKTSDAGESVSPGDTVTYTVSVENSGAVAYTDDFPAVVTDDLTDVLDDATYNGDASADPDQGTFTFTDPYLVWESALEPGDVVELTYSVTVNDPATGDGQIANVVTSPDSTCEEGSEDPDCGTSTLVKDLDVTKTVTPEGSAAPGDELTYEVTLTNTGAYSFTDADPASLVDDLTDVLDDAVVVDGPTVDPEVGTLTELDPYIVWVGPLAAGDAVVVTYTVEINDPVTGDGVVANTAYAPPTEPCTDPDGCESLPPIEPPEGCVDGSTPDGQPCGSTTTPVREVEIVKTSDAGEQAVPGQVVTYSVQVTNTGGADYTSEEPLTVTDDLTGVLDDATYNDDAAADPDQGSFTYSDPELVWSGPLDAGATVTLTYSVTVNDPVTGDGSVDNAVVGPPESNCYEPMSPAGASIGGVLPMAASIEDCSTTVPVVERPLEIVKTSDAATDVTVGDDVTYTVTVTNTGEADYTETDPATVVDDMTQVLDDATYNNDASASPAVGEFAFESPQLFWSGPLAAGESVTLTYSVTLTGEGDGDVLNVVFQPSGPGCTTIPDCGDITPPDPGECTDGVDENGQPCDEHEFTVTPPTTPTPGPSLPVTGAQIAALAALVLLLLIGGAALLGSGRLRRRHDGHDDAGGVGSL